MMKKFFVFCFIVAVAYGAYQDIYADNAVEYVTPDGSPERVAEEIIRDVWGARSNRPGEEPIKRVESIKSIRQADGTLALDMRIHIEGNTEHGVLTGLLDHSKKFFPKLATDERLSKYNEFRLYGALPMTDGRGNVSELNVSKVFFTRKGIQDVAWNKIETADLHYVLTKKNDGKNCTYWVHGGILSKIKWLKTYYPQIFDRRKNRRKNNLVFSVNVQSNELEQFYSNSGAAIFYCPNKIPSQTILQQLPSREPESFSASQSLGAVRPFRA